MPVCPECGDAHLEQLTNTYAFTCSNGHTFTLVRAIACALCGRCVPLLPKGLCEVCNRLLSEVK